MEYFYGKITKLPRKTYDIKGKRRLGEILLLEGERSGERLKFDVLKPPPSVAVKRNSIVRLHGLLEDDIIIIPDVTGIAPRLSPTAVMTLLKHDLPDIDPEALIRACGADKLEAVFDLFKTDEESFYKLASTELKPEHLEAVVNFFLKCKRDHDYQMLCDILPNAEPGIDMHDIFNIFDLLEHRAKRRKITVTEMVRREPWIISQAEGISFKQSDEVAKYFGYEGLLAGKIAGAIMNVLWNAAHEGHTYMPKYSVIKRAVAKLVGKNADYTSRAAVEARVKDILQDKNLRDHFRGMWIQDIQFASKEIAADMEKAGVKYPDNKGRGLYLCVPFRGERYSAKRLVEIIQAAPKIEISPERFLEKALEKYPDLDAAQKKAVLSVAQNPVTLLTGLAGSGKTEVIAAVVSAMQDYTLDIRLMAPTGIAAQRLSERSGLPASTIHVGVKISKDGKDLAEEAIRKQSDDEILPDFTVIDEVGMCDIVAFYKVLQNVALGSRLLLVGDPAQLKPPGPGNIIGELKRLAKSRHKPEGFNYINLVKDHRGSTITRNATRIRKGEAPVFSKGFELIVSNNNQSTLLYKLLDRLIAEGVLFSDILILSPRKGEKGDMNPCVEALNCSLQSKFNIKGEKIKNSSFRIGDPVICIENDYKDNAHPGRAEGRRDVFNGEKGTISAVEGDILFVDYKDGRQPYTITESSRWLQLAYAMTIHKAQGGESPVVIITDWENNTFTRSMLYTAVTRAKYVKDKPYSERVYFIVPEGFVEGVVANEDKFRYTKLYYRILDNLGVEVTKTIREVIPFLAPLETPPMVAMGG